MAAENPAAAHEAVKALKSSDGGRAAIVFGDWPAHTGARPAVTLPPGTHWANDLVEAPQRLAAAVSAMLASVVVVDELGAAIDVVLANPLLRAVTIDGDRVGAGWVAGGSDKKQSTLEVQAAIEAAREELRATETQVGRSPPRWPAHLPSRPRVRTPPSRRWQRSTNPTRQSRRCTSSWGVSARRFGLPPKR